MRSAIPVLAWGILFALLGYQTFDLSIGPSLDSSWQSALHVAAQRDMAWGDDVIFTYGPLGYLEVPTLYYDRTVVGAILWDVGWTTLAFGSVFAIARRGLGTPLAFVAAVLVGVTLVIPQVAASMALAVLVAVRADRHPHVRVLLAVLGAAAGISVLAKMTGGLVVGTLGAVAVLMGPGTRHERLRDGGVWLGVLLSTLLVLWVLIGQPLGALDDYIRTAIQIVSGYAAAMQYDDPGRVAEYTLALVVAVAGGVLAWRAGEIASPATRARWAALALWSAAAFMQFRAGFVRHDAGHSFIYFSSLPLALLAFAGDRRMRGTAVAVFTICFVIVIASTNRRLDTLVNPIEGPRSAVEQLQDLADRDYRNRMRAEGRDRIIVTTGIPEKVLAAVGNRTVAVHPTELSVVWAYGLNWRPIPVLQSYQSYTDKLDEIGAEFLSDRRRAPERVLLQAGFSHVDGRVTGLDVPATNLALICHYRTAETSPTWTAAARSARDRCGERRPLSSTRFGWEQRVDVPAPRPGTVIVAELDGVGVHGLERLRTFFFKSHIRRITLGGGSARLTPGTADGPLVLRAADDVDTAGQVQDVPFFSIEKATQAAGRSDLEVRFYEVPVAP